MIGVDLDDSLVKLFERFVLFHNDFYGTGLAFEDMYTFQFWEILGCDKEEGFARLQIFYTTDYSKNLEPLEGSQQAIQYLASMDKLVVITSREKRYKNQTYDTVTTLFPGCFQDIILEKNKKKVCDEKNIWVMVDDSLENALSCAEGRKMYMIDQPWNQVGHIEGIDRVHLWADIIEDIYTF